MKQPKVKLFGNIYNVKRIEWDKETGGIDHIIYIYPSGETNFIFQFDKIDYGHEVKELTEPITHPHDGYVGVPSFDSIFVEGTTKEKMDEIKKISKKYNVAEYIKSHGGSVEYVKKHRRGEL